MQRISANRIWQTIGFVLALLLASTTCTAFETISSRHFDSTTLVFKQAELSNPLFPASIQTRNLPAIFSSQLKFSCRGVRSGRSGVLLYLTESNECMSMDSLRLKDNSRRGNKPETIPDQKMLMAKLESSTLLVMQPMAAAPAIEGACYCPPPPPPPLPELIFIDGFELRETF